MAYKLVWVQPDGWLSCGHARAAWNGKPGPDAGEWYCAMCALHITAALDQELAAAADEARQRGEARD
jgi:hypothetical protein